MTAGQVPPAWPPGTGPGELTLPALLQWRAAELGDKPLLRIGPVTRSYQQVCAAAAQMAAALADRGVSRGDRVAALCGNRIELMDLILGCGWLGATVVPLNTALRGTSLRQALDAVGAPFVLAEPHLAARIAEAAPPGLQACWLAGAVPGGALPGGAVPGGAVPGDAVPGDAVPGDAMPGGAVPGGAMPGGAVPGGAMPGGPVPGDAVPGGPVPGDAVPGGAVPGDAVPGGVVSGGVVSGGAVPGDAVPGDAVPGGAMPGGAVPGGAMPGGAVPGDAVPGDAVSAGRSPVWQPAPSPAGYAPRPAAAVRPADTLAILFTSGTTGTPLGVCSPHEQFAWWGINVSRTLRIQSGDVLYTCLPLFHTNALNAFAQAIVAGATYVLGTRFSASAFWGQLREADATVTYLLGAMVGILMSRPPAATDRAHRCRVALAPATPAHQQAAFRERFGIVLVDGFGSTETNLVIGAPPEEQRPGHLGRVLTGFEAAVVGADDQPVPDDTPGELVLRSQHRHAFATGYWQLPDRTAQAWRGQWFHTGDRVIRDPSGWFTFVDRIKDVIRRRGENISSRQVEEVLAAHEDVVTAAAFAVPAEFAEDEVMVAVVRKPGSSAGAADLLRHCEQQLPYFAVPRYVDLIDELPLTETGKIAKSELRQRGITPTTWDREAAGFHLRRDQ